MALLDFRKHVVRNGLQLFGAVLNREPVDDPEFDFAGGNLVPQQVLKDFLCFGADGGADAIAAEHADDYGTDRRVINPVAFLLQSFDSLQLLLEYCSEVLFCRID